MKAGIARESALKEQRQRVRRLLSWDMSRQGLSIVPEWGEGGKVMWAMTAVFSYFFLGRASEMFAYNDGKIHEDFESTRGDVSIFWKGTAVSTGNMAVR